MLWGRLGPVAVANLSSFTPQDFAQTLWAFATAGVPYQVGCRLSSEACCTRPNRSLWTQAVTVLCWAVEPPQRNSSACETPCLWVCGVCPLTFRCPALFLATPCAFPQPLLSEATSIAPQLVPGLTPQGIGNVLWALTTLTGHIPPQVLAPIQEACLRSDLDSFGSVNMTMLVGALARQGSMRVELGVAVNRAVERSLHTFAGDNLCKCVAAAGFYALSFALGRGPGADKHNPNPATARMCASAASQRMHTWCHHKAHAIAPWLQVPSVLYCCALLS